MAILTYEWQELGSATLYNNIVIKIDGILISQSTQYNSSTVQFRFRNTGTYWRTTNGTATFNGLWNDSGGCATYPNYIYAEDTIFQITKNVSHDSNGDVSFYLGGILTAIINNGTRTANIQQFSVELPHINRFAFITNCYDINDEQNPYFTFSNSANYTINAYINIIDDSNTEYNVASRLNIANTGNYTFELTNTERNYMREKCTNKTATIRYILATCYDGSTESYWDIKNKILTIVNSDPTFNATYQDSNNTTIAITNNNQQIIQNNSTLQFNITNATAYKYATLSSVSITINGVTQSQPISSSTLTFNYGAVNIASNIDATILLTDSRGFTKTLTIPITILSWSLPSAIITLNRKSNYYTATDINVDANYSSLDSKNTITIKYRKKKKTDSTWSSYSNLSDNVTTTFDADNLYEWDIQVQLQDRIGQTIYNLSVGIGIPIMFVDRTKRNVGIDCFPQIQNALEVKGNAQINGNMYIAKTDGSNPISILPEYSTSEKMIGYWEDSQGNVKPLYRKTFYKTVNHTSSSATETYTQSLGVSNVDVVFINQGKSYAESGGSYFGVSRLYNNGNDIVLKLEALVSSSNITIEIYGQLNITFNYCITVEYTKTTD